MCEGSNLSAVIENSKVPLFDGIEEYLSHKCIPGGTGRNWESFGHHVSLPDRRLKAILCDPQTSGGLLIAVEPHACEEIEKLLIKNHLPSESIGYLTERREILIEVVE